MKGVRESFATKILVGLMGTVGVLLLVLYLVVQAVTEQQVEASVQRAVAGASTQFRQLEDLQRQLAARLARPFTEGRRAQAALEEALDQGDVTFLAGQVAYELDLAGLEDVLIVFTDAAGEPILTLHDELPMGPADPVSVAPMARRLLDGVEPEVRGYRVVDGRLYSVRSRLLRLGGRPIGTVSFGLSLSDEDVARIGRVVGVEVCFVVDGRCVAGTEVARQRLAPVLADVAGADEDLRTRAAESSWWLRAQPLVEGDPSQGHRVVAVPLGPVLEPFNRITRALLLGGLGALALAALVGLFLSRRLTEPVRELVEATGRVGRGDYAAEVSVRSRDEVGRLADAFNEMTRGLRLKERYRSVLDKVVSREVAEELMKGDVELGGEIREAAVLFADVRGFTGLTEGMEPQAVIGLLNECMERLSQAVEEEGGVVDKYVGDELMAVFGVPLPQGEDTLRALRAARRMLALVEEWNLDRTRGGLPPIEVGVGVNAGEVVAGNMGSRDRLNYTVLGQTVNVASRLCSAAAPGEILTTAGTLEGAGGDIRARSLGRRTLKGFSTEVEVCSVEGVGTGSRDQKASGSAVLSVLLAGLLSLPAGAGAQEGGLPTLREAGLEYLSSTGRVQVSLSGQLDLETLYFEGAGAGLAHGSGTVFAPRLRLFTDVFVGDGVYGLLELRADRGPVPTDTLWDARVEQAYLRLSNASGSLSVQAGRFASPFGSYAGRHLTEADPFVRAPLAYDYRTVISRTVPPMDAEDFITWKDHPDHFRPHGPPPVWDVPYQWGAMVAGASGAFSYRVAAMNSAPSSEPWEWGFDLDRFESPSWVVGVGLALSPELSLGASWNRGPFTDAERLGAETLPGYSGAGEYLQEMVALDATFSRGPLVARAEVLRDRWEMPNIVEDAVEWGYSAEAQLDLLPGLFVAARWGALDFRPLFSGPGDTDGPDWDHDVSRYEASLGYRIAVNVGALASWSVTDQHADIDPEDDLFALRLWWAF